MDDYLLEEKYRPKTKEEFIWINKKVEESFSRIIKTNNIPNMILHSRNPGSGKTSTVKSLVDLCQRESLFINFSLEGNIQTLKTKIDHFARTMSFNGRTKVVIMDEIDSENAISAKNFFNAFRPLIEKYSSNCRFLATCNNLDIIPTAILSRFDIYEYTPDNKKEFAKKILRRLMEILKLENIEYETKTIVDIIKKYSPDMRKMLKFINQYRNDLKDTNLVYSLSKGKVDKLFDCIKENNFKAIKDLIINDLDDSSIFRFIYDGLKDNIKADKIPSIIMCIAEYQRYHFTVPDRQINMISMLLEISQIINE
jgi:Straboviridae sliding clamp loader